MIKSLENYDPDIPVSPKNFIGTTLYSDFTLQHKYLTMTDHLSLYYTKMTPLTPAKASLVIVHGFGEHSHRFSHIAYFFCLQGYEVHMIDLAGFGYSGGMRFISSIKMFHQNIHKLLQQVRSDLPLCWYGHSMGGALTLSFLMRNQDIKVSGVVLSAPLLNVEDIDWQKKLFLYLLGKKLNGILHISTLSINNLVRDNTKLYDIVHDRLMAPIIRYFKNFSCGLARELVKMCRYIIPKAYLFTHPVLLIQGENDNICRIQYAKDLFEKIQSKDKELKIFKNCFHEIQHDFEKEEFKNCMYEFFEKKLNNSIPLGTLPLINYGVIGTKTSAFRFLFLVISTFLIYLARSQKNQFSKIIFLILGLIQLIKAIK